MNAVTKFINNVDEWLSPLDALKEEDFKGELLASAGLLEKISHEDKAKTKEKLNFLLNLLNKLRIKLGLDKSDIPKVGNIIVVVAELAIVIEALVELLKSCDIIGLDEGEIPTEDDKEIAVQNALRAILGFMTQTLFKKRTPRLAALFEAAGIFSDEQDELRRALDLVLFPFLYATKEAGADIDPDMFRPTGDPKADDALRITRAVFLILSIVTFGLQDDLKAAGRFYFNHGYELQPPKEDKLFPVAASLAGRAIHMQFVSGRIFDPDDNPWHRDSSLIHAVIRDVFLSFVTIPVLPPNAEPDATPLGYQYLLDLELNPGPLGPGTNEPGLKNGGLSLSFPSNFSAGVLWGHGIDTDFLRGGLIGLGAGAAGSEPVLVGRFTAPKPKEGDEASDLNSGDISFSIQPLTANGKDNLELRLTFHEFSLGVSGDGRDGFLQKILPEDSTAQIKASFSIIYNIRLNKLRVEGLDGNEGLLFGFKVGKTIFGKLDIPTLYVGLKPLSESGSLRGLGLEASAMMKLALGPFSMSVDRVGLFANIAFPKNGKGNLGPVDLDLGLKPPTGIGFLVKASVIKGGGFLSIDPANHQYFGAGELSITLEKLELTLKVVAVILTQMPDGTKGFSFLLLASVEFTPTIDMPFGFKLKGAGILAATHRSLNLDAFAEGVRDDRLDSILFPENPVANAATIVKALSSFFPATQDRYVFGLMARIGWGSRKLVDIKLGLLVEVPQPLKLALAGVIKVTIEERGATILKLQINFGIGLDLGKKMLSVDAAIYDSKFLIFDIRGQMFVRYSWGNEPIFLFSVGGFHPDFQIPAGLGLPAKPERLTIPLKESKNLSLILSCYVAFTSNTIQGGFDIELKMRWSKFRLEAGLKMDALFHFDPFYFVVDFEGKLRIYWGDSRLAGVTVKGAFSGTTPWRIRGTATFEIWIWDYDVDFDHTFGDEVSSITQETTVLPLIKKALEDRDNWQTPLPPQRPAHIILRNTDGDIGADANQTAAKPITADPLARLEVMQQVTPLGIRIDKLGFQTVKDFRKYDLVPDITGGQSLSGNDLEDFFAAGMYLDLSDAEKLSRKSFERMKAGRAFGDADSVATGPVQVTPFEYDEKVYDTRARVEDRVPVSPPLGHFQRWLAGNSVARSAQGRKSSAQKEITTRATALKTDPFVLADAQSGARVQEAPGQKSMSEAYYEMWKLQQINPLRKLQVVRESELLA